MRRGTAACLARIAILLLAIGAVSAGDVNQLSSVLVYPVVLNETGPGGLSTTETFVTLTHAGTSGFVGQVYFVGGTTCSACLAADLDLAPNESVLLTFRRSADGELTEIVQPDGYVYTCPGDNGFAVAVQTDASGNPGSEEDALLGNGVVVDYDEGRSYSTAPVPFQAGFANDGNLILGFDDHEYTSFPLNLASTFVAPETASGSSAHLALFTLGFLSGSPPSTSCTITGFDPTGESFAGSLDFGCWTFADLASISPQFAYPELGTATPERFGSVYVGCSVDSAPGGVHGAIVQSSPGGTVLRPGQTDAPAVSAPVSWARTLHESYTTGDAFSFNVEDLCTGLGDVDCSGSICDLFDCIAAIDQALGDPISCEADVDSDCAVDVFDVVCIIYCNLGRPSCLDDPYRPTGCVLPSCVSSPAAAKSPAPAEETASVSVRLDASVLRSRGPSTARIRLVNEADSLRGLSLTVNVPAGWEATELKSIGRAAEVEPQYHQDGETVKILLLSLDGRLIGPGREAVLELSLSPEQPTARRRRARISLTEAAAADQDGRRADVRLESSPTMRERRLDRSTERPNR